MSSSSLMQMTPDPYQFTSVCGKNVILSKYSVIGKVSMHCYTWQTQDIHQMQCCLWKGALVQPNCHFLSLEFFFGFAIRAIMGHTPSHTRTHTLTPYDFRISEQENKTTDII